MRKMQGWASMVLLLCGSAVLARAQRTAPNVVYSASGTFATPAQSGNDLFKLAGQPFNINILASTATHPNQHGKGWADYIDLHMRGTVHSGLDPSPVPITSTHTFMVLALGNPNYDIFEMSAPVIVVKQKIMVQATIHLPHGTLTGWLVHPFSSSASLDLTNATVTYSNGSDSTTLLIASGTVNGAYPNPQK